MAFCKFDKATGLFQGGHANPPAPPYDPATEIIVELPDFPAPDQKWDGTKLVTMNAAEIEAGRPPDKRGFEGALKAIFASDVIALNRLLLKYPLFLWSLRDENWAYVEQMLMAAKQTGDLTPTQYDAIKAEAAAKRIPVRLP